MPIIHCTVPRDAKCHFLGVSFNANWLWKYCNTLHRSMASRDAKCCFWVFPSTPTGSETITILYTILWRQGMQNVIFGCFLQRQLVLKLLQYCMPFYVIKGCKMSFLGVSFNANWFWNYYNTLRCSTASKGGKCHFWAYLVFYQTPSSCTLNKRVPGYSTASKGGKCRFWAYLVFCEMPSSCTLSKRVPGYSTASKGWKCHFWVYVVFYQMPRSCTLSKRVPGYSTASNGGKCHFWVYVVFY